MAQRPGAMTAAMKAVPAASHETWLRIGVVRSGAIVEDRWLRTGRSLTWGCSERSDVVVAGAPHDRVELVRATARGWEIAGGIAGRLSRGGGSIDLAHVPGAIALEDGARARVELGGGVVVLVERRMRPPEHRGASLPTSGGALAIDRRFTTVALGSLIVHCAFVLIAGEIDPPYVSALERLDRAATPIFLEPPLPDAPTTEGRDGGDTDADTTEDPRADAEQPPPSREHRSPRAPRSAPSDSEVALARADATAQVEQLLIGALGESGALEDVLRGGGATTSMADVMGTVAADGHAALDPHGPRGFEVRDGPAIPIGDLDRGLDVIATGPAHEGRTPVTEIEVRTIVTIDDPPEPTGPGELPPDVLAQEIARRRRRVQVCYEHALTRESPDLAGRMVVQMRVEQTGTLSRVRVASGSIGSDAFHACVVHAFDGFRTSAPPIGGAVDVTFPFVFAPQR